MAVHVSSNDFINNHTAASSWVLDREENLIVKNEETVLAIYRRGYWDYAVIKDATSDQ